MESPANPSADPASALRISTARMATHYSNMCRGTLTAEEIVLDFGFNPNSGGQVTEEPAEMQSRVILSPSSAVRLHQLLHVLLTKRQEAIQQAAQQAATAPPAGQA